MILEASCVTRVSITGEKFIPRTYGNYQESFNRVQQSSNWTNSEDKSVPVQYSIMYSVL